MFALTLLTPCLVFLAMIIPGSTALPTPDETTGRLAPRAVTSAGITCYFTCPPTAGGGNNFGVSRFPQWAVCYYQPPGTTTVNVCTYSPDGTDMPGLYNNQNPSCPPKAMPAGCFTGPSSPPNPSTDFRRGVHEPRSLSKAQRAIRDRQFDPRKVKSLAGI